MHNDNDRSFILLVLILFAAFIVINREGLREKFFSLSYSLNYFLTFPPPSIFLVGFLLIITSLAALIRKTLGGEVFVLHEKPLKGRRYKGKLSGKTYRVKFCGDLVIVESLLKRRIFCFFRVKGIHEKAFSFSLTDLTSSLHHFSISGSMEFILYPSKGVDVVYSVKLCQFRLGKEEKLVEKAKEVSRVFESMLIASYSGLINLERIKGKELKRVIFPFLQGDLGKVVVESNHDQATVSNFRKTFSLDVYVVKQSGLGFDFSPMFEKLFESCRENIWLSIIFEPIKRRFSLHRLSLYNLKRSVEGQEKEALSSKSMNKYMSLRELYKEHERRQVYDRLVSGERIGFWRVKIILTSGVGERNNLLAGKEELGGVIQVSLLSGSRGKWARLHLSLKAKKSEKPVREVESQVLRDLKHETIILTSDELSSFIKMNLLKRSQMKLYLSPQTPIPNQAKLENGEFIRLGKVLNSSEKEAGCFSLSLNALNRHVIILGSTGSGKSTTAKIMVYELSRKRIPTLVLDWTGEYVDSLLARLDNVEVLRPGSNFSIDFFTRKSEDKEEIVSEWLSTLNYYVYTVWGEQLTALQRRVLLEGLNQLIDVSSPSFKVLQQKLFELEESESQFRVAGWIQSIEAVVSRIQPLTYGKSAEIFDNETLKLDFWCFFHERTNIIDLSHLNEETKVLFCHVFSKKLFDFVKKWFRDSRQLNLVYIIDEAQNIVPQLVRQETLSVLGILEKYALELRKYGVGLVTITSRPSLISKNVMASGNTIITHKLVWKEDVDRMSETLGLIDPENWRPSDKFKQLLKTLPIGQALVKIDNPEIGFPFMVKMGLEEHRALVMEQYL